MIDQSRKLEMHALGIKDDDEPVADFRADKTHQMNAHMRDLYEVQADRHQEIIAGLNAEIERILAEWKESDRKQRRKIGFLHLSLFGVALFAIYMAAR